MASLFWNSLEKAREKAGKERKAVEKECNLPNNAFTQGIKRQSSPSVDLAYRLAQAVGMSIEELVAGEAGAEYVRKIAKNDPWGIQVPDRIAPIVQSLLLLDDKELVGIRANVEALAADKKGIEHEPQTGMKPGNETEEAENLAG
jgi:transcriptional regulator with XRE-family HTH domain